ncbi:MAG: (d)CMP kinase [bacterium]|nr:(d)CMP kinase [bacterium]
MAEGGAVFQVAIDGPAASGKSSTARLVAAGLGIRYLDTGAMYRALTLDILRQGVSPEAEALVVKRLETLDLRLQEGRIWLAGEDVGEAIRANEVSVRMGPICAMPTVRAWMVALQRRLGSLESTVLDGRDIGTVVFPAARFKFFLVADLEERARRRQRELAAVGQPVELALLAEELRRRDESDAARSTGPLTKAADAVELDTTRLGLQEQAELILGLIRAGLERGGEPS